MMLLCGLVAIMAACIAPFGVSHASDAPPAQTETRFAFLPNIFIDLERGIEVNRAMMGPGVVRDCSTSGMNCLTGATFNIAWPKMCGPYQPGQRWQLPSGTSKPRAEFEVLSDYTLTGGLVSVDRYLVSASTSDDVLYIFETSKGLVGIAEDPAKTGKLAKSASDSNLLAALQRREERTADGYLVSHLVGYGHVGTCAPMIATLEKGKKVYSPVD